MLVSLVQCLTITGEGERLSEVLTDDSDLHADPQTLMQLLLTHRRRPHEAGVLRAVAVWVRRTQPDQTKLSQEFCSVVLKCTSAVRSEVTSTLLQRN